MPAAAEIVDLEEAAVTASVEELVPADEAIEAVPPAHADNGKSDTRRKGRGTRKPAAKRARKKTDHAEAADGATDAPPTADTQHVAEPVAPVAATMYALPCSVTPRR